MLTVRDNHQAFDAQLARDLGRDLPFAVARAITWTLKDVQKNSPNWMRRDFDNPVRWTLNSMRVEPATKRKGYGRVYFKDEHKAGGKGTNAGRYLLPNIKGTRRPHTRWEKFLIARGVMHRNEYAMPASGIRLDRHGNVPSRIYPEIIAQLRLGINGIGNASETTMRRRKARGVGRIFIPQLAKGTAANSLHRGIWHRRKDGTIEPLFIFTENWPAYEVRFPWKVYARKTVANHLPHQLRRSARMILSKPNR
ncbi:hypothetical protein [Oricola thermophila]|uniref:Uncharacterized protein n=1 Tax=Oricola thermophila TaxID=2742145 RepID=A0A6N1VDD2_9HYPH|nr:hypothetical protein [Oricola thermophila]QKV18728.1 hypothetical protein HTY61_09835 [Oricola thermophila]